MEQAREFTRLFKERFASFEMVPWRKLQLQPSSSTPSCNLQSNLIQNIFRAFLGPDLSFKESNESSARLDATTRLSLPYS
jgi:hypothetical protein